SVPMRSLKLGVAILRRVLQHSVKKCNFRTHRFGACGSMVSSWGDGKFANGIKRKCIALLLLSVCLVVGCADKTASQSNNPAIPSEGSPDASGSGLGCDVAGEFRCIPEAPELLEFCDPSTILGWSEFRRCGAPDLCDAEGEQCLTCSPMSFRCDGWRLQRCN